MSKKDRKQRKKKRREKRLRQAKHQRKLPSARQDLPYWLTDPLPSNPHDTIGEDDADDVDSLDWDDEEDPGDELIDGLGLDLPPSASVFALERRMRLLAYAMNHKQFSTQEEVRAWLEPFFDKNKNGDLSLLDDPKEQAQELAYRSLESGDPLEIERLAREALKLDPHCLDALNRLIPFEAGQSIADVGKHLELYKKILAIGRKDLESEGVFELFSGDFWLEPQTRPFMRLLNDSANAHFIVGDLAEAQAELEEMLELDLEDSLGARFTLLACTIESGQLAVTRRILKSYIDDEPAPTRWAWALERFLSGDLKTAERALARARQSNRYFTRVLAGEMPMPEETGETGAQGRGSPHEARELFNLFGRSFVKYPAAAEWIVEHHKANP